MSALDETSGSVLDSCRPGVQASVTALCSNDIQMMPLNDLDEIYVSDDESDVFRSSAPATACKLKSELEFTASVVDSSSIPFPSPDVFKSDAPATACEPKSGRELTASVAGSSSIPFPAPTSHLSPGALYHHIPSFFGGSLTSSPPCVNSMFHVAPPITNGSELVESVLYEDTRLTEHVMSLILAQIPSLIANPVGLRFIAFRELVIMKHMNGKLPGLYPYIVGESTAAINNIETSVVDSSNSQRFCSFEAAGESGFNGWNRLASIWSYPGNPTIAPPSTAEVIVPPLAPVSLQSTVAASEVRIPEGTDNKNESSLASVGSTNTSLVGTSTYDLGATNLDVIQNTVSPVWHQSTSFAVSTASRPGCGPTSTVSAAVQSTVTKPTSAGVPMPRSALTACNTNSSERAANLSESTTSSSGADGCPGSKRSSLSQRTDGRSNCHSADTLDEFNLSGAPPLRTTTKRRESPTSYTGLMLRVNKLCVLGSHFLTASFFFIYPFQK